MNTLQENHEHRRSTRNRADLQCAEDLALIYAVSRTEPGEVADLSEDHLVLLVKVKDDAELWSVFKERYIELRSRFEATSEQFGGCKEESRRA